MKRQKAQAWAAVIVVAVAAALATGTHAQKAVDFRVYYETARQVARGGPMYGPTSGTGWPGIYRYPPLLVWLMLPVARLKLSAAVAACSFLKVICIAALGAGLVRRWTGAGAAAVALWPAALLLAPFLVAEIHTNNVQFFVVALAATALALMEPGAVAGGVLGFAVALKTWPLFFVPCVAAMRRWRVAAVAVVSAALFTLLPATTMGWDRLTRLLREWYQQEYQINLSDAGVWFPGQSLHDVMMRFLTRIDYGRLIDPNYQQVAWLDLAPHTVERIWMAAAWVVVAGLLLLLWQGMQTDRAASLMFCTMLIMLPHVHVIDYVALFVPAVYAATKLPRHSLARALFLMSAVAAAALALVPGSAAQRGLQVYGAYFWLVLLPLTGSILFGQNGSSLRRKTDSSLAAAPQN